MAKKNIKLSFEKSVVRLEEISSLLESETIGLEESITLYEEGIKLSQFCIESLNNAQLKIIELKKSLDNSYKDPEIFEE
ncbi:MAG: exodeoxyribonuclease VII small subunit [Ignavibacteriaceae bacterium]